MSRCETCSPGDDKCPSGLVCHSASMTCQPKGFRPRLFGPCRLVGDCKDGEYCWLGICHRRKALGMSCTSSDECRDGLACSSTRQICKKICHLGLSGQLGCPVNLVCQQDKDLTLCGLVDETLQQPGRLSFASPMRWLPIVILIVILLIFLAFIVQLIEQMVAKRHDQRNTEPFAMMDKRIYSGYPSSTRALSHFGYSFPPTGKFSSDLASGQATVPIDLGPAALC